MMKDHNIHRLRIHSVAAAVALALSSTFAAAQQRDHDQGEHPEAVQQQSRDQEQPAQGAARSQQSDRAATADRGQSSRGGDLAGLADDHADLSTFVEALETAGLVDSLTDGTSYTIFAPTDEAFESMRKDTSELLSPQNREELVALLRAHIVADDVDAAMARRIEEAQTLDGDTVDIKTEDGKLMIGDAEVVESDIERGNVRIHSIDKVLGQRTRVASGDGRDREG